MTKKELQAMVTEAIRKVVREEVKPLIETTIRKEFYKILNEAELTKPKRTMISEDDEFDSSLINLIDEDIESDPARAQINEKIFKGKTPFADVLNQTANDVLNRTGVYANPLKQAVSGQMKVKLNNKPAMVEGQTPAAVQTSYSREQMAAKMGYGEIEKVGRVDNIPGIAGSKPKSPALQKIMAKEKLTPSAPLNEVELPTTNADGKPINYANVPMDLVQNMMKNYSGLLKKVETKVNRPG